MNTATHETARTPGTPWRLALWGVMAVVLVHSAAIALAVTPWNIMRQVVGTDRLSSYVLPLWDQSWSVFAPDADYRTDRIEIRALLRGVDTSTYQSDWVPITSREVVASVRHHPFPSRTALITNRLAGRVFKAYGKLTPAQKKAFGAADTAVDLDALRMVLLASATSDKERAAATDFLEHEQSVEYFLSGIADAIWGDRLVGVQYRRYVVEVPSYSRPHDHRQVARGIDMYSNVRPVHALSSADRTAYAAYVDEFGLGGR